MVKVKDIMRRDVPSVSPSASIIDVARKLRDCGTGILPVCEKGKLHGLITERDIVSGIVATASDPAATTVRSLMHKHQPIISPDDDMMQATRVMANNGVRLLSVVQNGELLGLLTLDELSRESLALAAMVLSKTLEPQVSKKTKAIDRYLRRRRR